MRLTRAWLFAFSVVTQAAVVYAQAPPSPSGSLQPTVGEIDFGVQLAAGLDEVGRYQRFIDPRSSATVNRLRFSRDRETWRFDAALDRVGYRDQRYAAAYERYGKVKASFEWNQIPLWFGGQTASPYREVSPGVFRLDDAAQLAVQNRTATIAAFAPFVESFDTRARRDIAAGRVVYSATRNLDLIASFTSTARTGTMPWNASFGFSDAVELAASLDNRTNDISTVAEWSSRRGTARIGYDGSFFSNSIDTIIWDNPMRATDQTNANAYSTGEGAAQGRESFWPDSTAHTVSASGSVALPARSRAFAYVSLGSWLQDSELLPHTINTAITPIPLARQTAEGEARIVSMMYRYTARPTSAVWISGQYRLYDYDNRTPHFPVDQYVRLDGTVSTSPTGGSQPFGMTRHFVDVDASFTPANLRHIAFRAGYAREHDDRTYRFLEKTTENTLRVSVDSTTLPWGSVRLQYDHGVRTGEGLDEEAFSDIGEQISLRQFDISDRTRDRVSAIIQVMASNALEFNGAIAVGLDNRPDAIFGLQDNNLASFTVGIGLTRDEVNLGLSYGFERLATLQRSRQANPGVQFDDPTRDWSTDLSERTHTWTTTVDVPRITSRTTMHAAYDYVRARARYLYELAPNSTLVPPVQLPQLLNAYHTGTVDVRHSLTRQLAVGVGYRLDKYSVDDFGRAGATLDTPLIPTYVNIMYRWVPYDVHTAFGRLIYRW
jgi:MtrB/PioB family decaheme-associated outer membrane protein